MRKGRGQEEDWKQRKKANSLYTAHLPIACPLFLELRSVQLQDAGVSAFFPPAGCGSVNINNRVNIRVNFRVNFENGGKENSEKYFF